MPNVTDSTLPQSGSPADQADTVMRLQGKAAGDFLHGQTTADFKACAPGDIRYAAFCNPKGRVLADILAVVVSDTEVLLRGRQPVMLKLAEHLTPYLAFSRCELSPTDWLVERIPGIQAEPHATLEYDAKNLTVVTIPVEAGYQEQWRPPRSREDHEPSAQSWPDILGNRARIELQTVGQYLPQDLNYDLNGTVSFSKGCYTGQEIIARLHYRGTPKRRLHRAQVAAPVASGDALIDAENRPVGSIVNHCQHSEHTELLLELVPAAAAGRVTLRAGGEALTHISPCHEDNDQSTGSR